MKRNGRRDAWLVFWFVLILVNAAFLAAIFFNNLKG